MSPIKSQSLEIVPRRPIFKYKTKAPPSIPNLKLLKQLRELTVFEHSHYGRIVSAEFDNVLIVVITK